MMSTADERGGEHRAVTETRRPCHGGDGDGGGAEAEAEAEAEGGGAEFWASGGGGGVFLGLGGGAGIILEMRPVGWMVGRWFGAGATRVSRRARGGMGGRRA